MNTTRNNCKDYERPWKNHCVDRGIQDIWLEKLNGLENFSLISICEGHEKRRGIEEQHPHINLRSNFSQKTRLKSDSIQSFVRQTRELLTTYFSSDIFITQLNVCFSISTQSMEEELFDYVIKIDMPEKWLEGDLGKNTWFEKAVLSIIVFDTCWGDNMKNHLMIIPNPLSY